MVKTKLVAKLEGGCEKSQPAKFRNRANKFFFFFNILRIKKTNIYKQILKTNIFFLHALFILVFYGEAFRTHCIVR